MISQNHRRRRPASYEPLTYSKPKLGSKIRRKTSSTSPRKSRLNIYDAFKIFASCILLASSAYTYVLFQGFDAGPHSNHGDFPPGFARDFVKGNRDFKGGNMRTRNQSQNLSSNIDESASTSTEKDVNHNREETLLIPLFVHEKLSALSAFDAYGISHEILASQKTLDESVPVTFNNQHQSFVNFKKISQEIRTDFASRYGGVQAARAILQKAISTFPVSGSGSGSGSGEVNNIEYTAQRIHQARIEKRQFRFGFAGYSVTTGRGNYFNQSFPFVMERILEPSMKALGIKWSVVNAGIGGVPSFPYGLCLDNFLGKNPDVVFWDFAMNEANDSVEGFEAYIRRVASLNKSKDVAPMLLVRDTMAANRTMMLQKYVNAGALIDPIVVHTDPAVDPFLEIDEASRPIGFREWREFGAPPNAPGKSRHHPAKNEHEFIGYVMAMHFLAALELLAAADMGLYQLKPLPQRSGLAAPVNANDNKSSSPWTSILLGNPKNDTYWDLKPVQCRTSFDPILEGNLKDILISKNVEDTMDIMLPKGPMVYNAGWVLDLGDAEKRAKQKLDRYGGLGFLDSKKAYYGVHASGVIEFFLPSREMSSVIVCESNENRNSMSCNMKTDASYSIGGALVEDEDISAIDTIGFTYLGRSICVHIAVPSKATVTTNDKSMNNESITGAGSKGFVLAVAVKSKRIRSKAQSCNVSHLIWL